MARPDKRQRKKENARAAREAREAARRRAQRRRNVVRVGVGLLVAAIAIGAGALLTDDDGNETAGDSTTTTLPVDATTIPTEPLTCTPDPGSTQTAKIATNFGEIQIALDDARAPLGASRFAQLAREGFYNGLTWHRAAADFVIQGGDPEGTGSGGKGDPIVAEVPQDNYPLGSLAAAKTGTDAPGTFDSQFFIVTGPNGGTLPNDYARFGCVVTGLEFAQQIEALAPPEGDGPPTAAATIDTIEIIETQAPEIDPTATTVATDTTPTTTGQE
ncbi:MAG: peptidylprolyl isomerase [Actinomycetota bacterium]